MVSGQQPLYAEGMNGTARRSPLVVVGVDGSNSSLLALGFAKEYAHKLHGRLRAVSTWTYPISYNPLPVSWSPEEETRSQLRQASQEVFGDTLPNWYESVVREGSAASNLIAESRAADVLIVGSRGHGGFAGLLLGSVSSQCASHSRCPVIVIHSADSDPNYANEAGQTGLLESARDRPVVVGHDGSANADEALEWALSTAAQLGASVEVVRTWNLDRIPPQFTEEHGYVPSFDEVTARVRRDLVAETRGLIERHPTVEVTLRAALARPAGELIASSQRALMVVVGSRGRGGFAGLILGSVSTECVAHAMSPIVVVPAASRSES
ncbi:Universal stress protein family [Leifsonia rubra CMS 76R]|nr:Universal stress protein family [Leifsonia rubra CMS 76R]